MTRITGGDFGAAIFSSCCNLLLWLLMAFTWLLVSFPVSLLSFYLSPRGAGASLLGLALSGAAFWVVAFSMLSCLYLLYSLCLCYAVQSLRDFLSKRA